MPASSVCICSADSAPHNPSKWVSSGMLNIALSNPMSVKQGIAQQTQDCCLTHM